MAVLAVVAIICQEQLGANKEDAAVQDDNSTVEAVVAVHDGHADVADDAVERSVGHDDGHLLPGMEVGVGFEDCQQSVGTLLGEASKTNALSVLKYEWDVLHIISKYLNDS